MFTKEGRAGDKHCLLFLGLHIAIWLSSCGPATATAPAHPSTDSIPNYTTDEISEPVFGGKMFVVEAGSRDAPTVVLVHGLGDEGARDWELLMKHLAPRYHVLAFDLPGFARSTRANELYSPTRYARLIKWLVSERVDGPFHLVGHSMGASLALLYASENPDDVESLIIADAGGILEHHVLVSSIVGSRRSLKRGRAPLTEGSMRNFDEFLLDFGDDFRPKLVKFLSTPEDRDKHLRGEPTRIAGLSLLLHNFGPTIQKINCPTLLIWGREDSVAPLRTGMILHHEIPSSRLEVIEGVGHVPMREAPDEFNRLALDFLENHSEPAGIPEDNATTRPDATQWQRVGRCQGERDVVFNGDYAEISIHGCERVVLRDVRVKRLVIDSSRVSLVNTQVLGGAIGMEVSGATVRMTNGVINGDTAIQANSSVLDLAGVRLRGKHATVQAVGASQVVFSVCLEQQSGETGETNHLHGLHHLKKCEALSPRSSGGAKQPVVQTVPSHSGTARPFPNRINSLLANRTFLNRRPTNTASCPPQR